MIISTHTEQDSTKLNIYAWDPRGGPVVKRLPSNARGVGSIPGWGSKIDPTCLGAMKPRAPTREAPVVCSQENLGAAAGPAGTDRGCFHTLVTVPKWPGKQFQFTMASKRIKHLKLTKEVKNKYTENFKTFITEMEEDTNKWKIPDICVHGLEELI